MSLKAIVVEKLISSGVPFICLLDFQLGKIESWIITYGAIFILSFISFQDKSRSLFGYTNTLKSDTFIVSGKSGTQ